MLRPRGASAKADSAVSSQGDKSEKAADQRASVPRLLSLLKPETGPMAIAVGTLVVTTASSLVLPAAIGHILDISLAPTTEAYTPVTIALGLLGLFTVQSVFIGLRTGLLAVAGERIATRIRRCVSRASSVSMVCVHVWRWRWRYGSLFCLAALTSMDGVATISQSVVERSVHGGSL